MRLIAKADHDLEAEMEKVIDNGERGVTLGLRAAGRGLKESWRSQIKSAGLGSRLANTVRGMNFPARGYSLGAASLVYVRPNNTARASAAEVVDAHDRGVLIKSREKFWLAIPTEAAVKMRGPGNKRIDPYGFEQRTGLRLRFVYRRGQNSLLVADQARINKKGNAARKGGRRRKDGILTGEQTVICFILVPQVRLRAKLDLDRDRKKWEAAVPGLIVSKWKD
ncbi:DUF6441 family protein [Celeribacter halophilus]|uniref:Uncharacterized protein n=1 Tax=Celeribacter halophilus TaxID=576117 RepID=A0A1I3WYK2_9RHOB|nr:DUF6441 family protein [Celeribacter halophilus]PZX04484.1 hypothetical protein LX82_03675 [Celeribacter halophilus]SFK12443.1 hypothetical protein SAMN04488138_1349 [Celeribacter halophilus]